MSNMKKVARGQAKQLQKVNTMWTRIRSQIQFAEWMSEQKDAKPAWKGLVKKAIELAESGN